MNNKILVLLIAVGILVIAIGAIFLFPRPATAPTPSGTTTGFDPLNATYIVDGQSVVLVNGKGGTTQVFGQPVMGDLNGDGKPDAAFFLVEQPGGSGTFYFVAAALSTATGTQGTNAILLGDRIAPQTLEIHNGEIVANYADRKPGEPMTTQPSVGVSKYLTVNGSALTEIPPTVGGGAHCGGNMINAPVCVTGYHCVLEPGSHLPLGDVGGVCVPN